jgi:acetyl-CoA C-acetyltransferase
MSKVYILDYGRTPIGCFMGNLSKLNAVELTTQLMKNIISKNNINKTDINMLFIGNVISTGLGQNIARHIGYNCGLQCPSITINNVCSSGMETIIQGIRAIKLNDADCVIVGGVESMSNTPFITDKVRTGNKYGNISLNDSMIVDGLTDFLTNKHMGELAEEICEKHNITRNMQDDYAKMSFAKAKKAQTNNLLSEEIIDIYINNDSKISNDEQINKFNLEKISKIPSVFKKNGTITAGNASSLADGSSIIILVSENYIKINNIIPKYEIISYEQTIDEPTDFPIIPVKSINNIIKKNNFEINDIDIYEINEAFSLVPILCNKYLGISYEKMNLYGGAISLGHPLGCSGNRIVGTLCNVLKNENKKLGCASICNGGGGATSILIQKIIDI